MRRPSRRKSQDSPTYEARTRDVLVRVMVSYLPQESMPEEGKWVWAYMVEIENHGTETVSLVTRHWRITDALNRTEAVDGPGVVGEQPILKAREAFRYTSGTSLPTPSGTMCGTYSMVLDSGDQFEAQIPEFSLHLPGAARKAH